MRLDRKWMCRRANGVGGVTRFRHDSEVGVVEGKKKSGEGLGLGFRPWVLVLRVPCGTTGLMRVVLKFLPTSTTNNFARLRRAPAGVGNELG
jgi:hypothetical protein